MGMRVTTGMSMNLYRYNLQNSTRKVDYSRNQVLTHRQFNSFGEAPAAAAQAWRLRRSIVNTDIYLSNNSDTYTRFNIAWATLGQASHDLTDLDGRSADIYAANDPTATGRQALGQVLSQTAESVIQTVNGAKSGEHFLFAGDDELNAPFTWGKNKWGYDALYYRGVDVNSGWSMATDGKGNQRTPVTDPVPDYWGEINAATGLPSQMPNKITNEVDKAWADYYEKMKTYNEEKTAYDQAWAGYRKDLSEYVEALEKYMEEYLEAVNSGNAFPEDLVEPVEPKAPDLKEPTEPESPATWADPFADDLADKTKLDDFGVPKAAYQELESADPATRAWADYYVDQGNYEKLRRMSEEITPVDLGMGMLEDDNNKLVDGTYYNRSLPGINMLGFGLDEDGDPKNVCMIMKRLGEIYSNCDPDTGVYSTNEGEANVLREEAMRLLDKLKAGQSNVSNQYNEINAKSSFLQQNEGRLALQADYLAEQLVGIEDIDPADAISQFMWDYNCYNAALKVGTQLLSQSLIDYMT